MDDKSILENLGDKKMNTPLLKYVEAYEVIDGNNVVFSIEIGDRQAGIIDIVLDGTYLKKDIPFKVENLDLGKGADLKGKFLNFLAVVDDVSDSNDRASIIYKLSGGISDFQKLRPYIFVDGQKTVVFRVQVKFE